MRVIASLVMALSIVGCEDDEQSKLIEAQNCIDTATAATVNSCITSISGDTSERAFVLKCSAAFISEGIDETAIVNALSNVDGEEAGDPTAPTIAALAMSSTTVSAAAVTTCTQTNSTALTALANFANLSTAMVTLLPGVSAPYDAAEIEAAIDAYNPATATAADKEALGNAIIASQSSLCSGSDGQDGFVDDSPACTDINQAIAANPNDPAGVADAFLANVDNQNN